MTVQNLKEAYRSLSGTQQSIMGIAEVQSLNSLDRTFPYRNLRCTEETFASVKVPSVWEEINRYALALIRIESADTVPHLNCG